MAESVASAAVENVTNQAMTYASPYLRYFFCYGEIVQDFTNQRNALILRKLRMDTRVDEAKKQNEVIYEDVEVWLRRAEQELEETQNLQDEIDRVKCFKWCTKCGWRYCLSKKLAEKTPIISKLLETSNFAQVGYRRPLQGIEFITSTDFMDSESSKSALNQIMEAMKVVNMIGLHGMPGVGKTTLAKEVGKHAREQRLFDKVVMFTMSQNPDINKIQHKVAAMFDLKFQTDMEDTKAEELWVRLKAEKDILIIVDDLWEEFKLESIGIPFGDDHKGCKILLTTRQQQVCSKMKCQKEIQLGILSKDEAWVLFRDQAGLEGDCSTLNDVAKEVARECKGLPLAIVTVAKALKGESLDGWKAANQRFKDSRHLDNEEVLGSVLKPLKLSYDYLKKGNSRMTGNDIQMCFLLCSLFPEDAEIDLELLIMCGIGVGLFSNASSIEDKRNEIGVALKKLQKSGLLLESDYARGIRMHDVVRDFAHWLTLTGENKFMVKDKLEEWPDMVESFECYTAIALWDCSGTIIKFPDKVEFSKLKTLFLQGEWKGVRFGWGVRRVVLSTFFEEMKSLQVLYLGRVYFSLKGLHFLPNLKTLWCTDCKLKNFSSSLTNMRNLEILALVRTEIDEISEELRKLSTLKYLRLSDVLGLAEYNIPLKLVSRLTSLQELHVTGKNNIDLLELNSLSCLTALSLKLSTNQFSQDDFVFPKLQRYNIAVDDYICFLGELTIRELTIKNFSSSLSAFNNLFCNVEILNLRKVSGMKNIVPSIGKKVLNELTSLELDSCDDMEFLIDITKDQGSTIPFSNLVKLNIKSMVSLKELCYGLSASHRANVSLTRLKVVIIESCPKLKTIFSPCLAQSMSCIEEVYIESCHGLEQVIGFAQEEEITKNDYPLCCWSKLRILTILSCKSLKYICANTWTQGLQSLESLHISDCPQFMQIFKMEQNESGQNIVLTKFKSQNHCWPKLKTLRIMECPIFSCFIVQAQLLEELELSNVGIIRSTDVPILNEYCVVVGNHEEVLQVQDGCSFSRIKKLYLRNLFEVQIIWKDIAQVVTLENLTTLKLSGCKKLRYIFSPTMARNLSHLVDLFIEGCEEIERLILAKDKISSSSNDGLQPITNIIVTNMKNHYPLLWPKLKLLYVRNCFSLEHLIDEVGNMDEIDVSNMKSHFPWPKLETVDIRKCKNLKYLCSSTLAEGLLDLKSIKIEDCPRLVQVFNIEKKKDGFGLENHCWPKLKTLRIVNCQILKYVFINTLSQGFPSLKSVYLKSCPQLKVFNPTEERGVIGDHILLNVPRLRNLSVSNCPQFSCFIVKAQFMKVLVLNNVGNSCQLLNVDLPLLNEDCVVVGNRGEVFQAQGECSFSSIQKLYLRNLFEVRIIWKDFAQVVTLKNLTTLKLSGCKKLRYIFSPTTARSLSYLVDLFIEGCEEMEQLILPKDQVSSSSSSSNGDTGLQPINFPNLTKISVTKCKSLKSLFPFGSVPVLPKLKILIVKRNSKLEQVFELEDEMEVEDEDEEEIEQLILAKDQVSSSSSNDDTSLQPISFPNLTKIIVTKCESLKSLFPFGFVPVLPKLESLIVKRNFKLEQVFDLEDEMEVETEEEMKFDKLGKLSLEELPSLIHFTPKGYHFVMSTLEELNVSDCPKLTTGFSIDSREFVHCKTKTLQLLKEDVIEESVTVSNAIFNEDISWRRWGFNLSQLPHIT
ncbi:hypothetical protein J1N35_028243 [Gossypium stocksii]|uniref:AAA+ ATPase domain-containing protein n=1 Tax=Gossypium stocksii TaxID=47602 RepID=A0A9D3UVI7_9ROSI|nr:hypothetical protein J1N35_028243 [Gossypium stocksii]